VIDGSPRILRTLTFCALVGAGASPVSAQDVVQASPKPLDVSFGINLRERFESDHAEFLGAVRGDSGEWLLQRLELRADVRLGRHVQVVAQAQSAFAPAKQILTPVDRDPLDLEQAFVAITEQVVGGTLTARLGRQLIAFDLQRFVSLRDVPSLHQPYDAAEAEYQRGRWHLSAAYTQPVQINAQNRYFSSRDLTFSGVRFELPVPKLGDFSAYLAKFTHNGAVFTTASGDERRNVFDVRLAGAHRRMDWDGEAMHQTGSLGAQAIEADAVGSSVGYTIDAAAWMPRIGLSFDAATGDSDAHDGRLETFNPLFPNGFYLANYTGYSNVIHVKPSLSLQPRKTLRLTFAIAGQWRETTSDAVYLFPAVPLVGTAGKSGLHTGTYLQTHASAVLTPHVALALDAMYYTIGDATRQAGGRNSTYVGLEIKYALTANISDAVRTKEGS
jgi:alginate export protein